MNAPHAERRPRSGRGGARTGREAASIVEPVALFDVARTAYGAEIKYDQIGVHQHDDAAPTTATKAVDIGHQRMANTVGAESWLMLAGEWIEQRAAEGRTLDADRLQAAVGMPPTAGLPAVAIRRAKLAGTIVMVGFTTSERPEARGHAIRTWGPR